MLFASRLLLNTDKTILEISNIIGFSSTKNFIEQFKKVFFIKGLITNTWAEWRVGEPFVAMRVVKANSCC